MGSSYVQESYKGYSVLSLPSQITDEINKPPSGLLEDAASYLIVFTHSCVEKITYLPFPIGTIIEAIEGVMYPVVHPVVKFVEGSSLKLLASIDEQIYGVATLMEGWVLCMASKLKLVLNLLHERGIVGLSADLWVRHEAMLKEKLHIVVSVANKIPLLSHLTAFIYAIATPWANTVCEWLLEHSQSEDKIIQLQLKELELGKEGVEEAPKGGEKGLEQAPKQVKDFDWSPDLDVVETKDVKEEEIKPIIGTPRKETFTKEVKAKTGNAQKGVGKEGQEMREEGGNAARNRKENVVDDLSNVLEMIDSGWLLSAPGVVSPRAATKTTPTPRKAVNPTARRGAQRHH